MPCQTAVKKIILFFALDHYRVCDLKKYFLRFCPVYITVTTGPSVLGWAWHKHKVLFHEFREVLIGLRERSSSSTLRKCTRWILSLHFFNRDQRAAQRKTFWYCNFLSTSSNAFRHKLRLLQGRLQLTLNSICSTYVSLSMTSKVLL